MPRFTGVMVLAALAQASLAIVPNLGEDAYYTFVGSVGGASATAIGARTVITAKHVPGVQFTVLGHTYSATSRTNHPNFDLAVLQFGEDLPGWYGLGTDAPIGSPLTMVGFGATGVLNDTHDGYTIHYSDYGRRRAAPNFLHEKWELPGYGPSLISYLNVNGDAAAANGDSGGAFFIGDQLVGVTSFAFKTNANLPNYGFAVLNGGVAYHGTGAIDLTVPEIHSWVAEQLVPEPSAWFVLMAGLTLSSKKLRRQKA